MFDRFIVKESGRRSTSTRDGRPFGEEDCKRGRGRTRIVERERERWE